MSGQIRRMPAKWYVVTCWEPTGVFDIEIEEPHCWACGFERVRPGTEDLPLKDQWNKAELERAHLVDHPKCLDDSPSNLVLLCGLCHGLMPSFGKWSAAIAWVTASRPPLWRLLEKALAEAPPELVAAAAAELS